MEELKDIKELLYIEDYSHYIFIFLIIIFAIILFIIIKKIISFKRANRPEHVAKRKLKNLDLSDTKNSAYIISKYGLVLRRSYNFEYLEKYKYKKEVRNFKKEDLKKIKVFLDAI
ncbi:MAG: hypothetical protein JJV95_04650 [Sulfurospirillum sp.]|nr:hypothetical protein [Sulfurospirillum sp.]MBL0703253.1 hypothetical protein [Sulfurospirillum sp.]